MADARRSAAVLFDKDGTLLQHEPYNVRPERMRLMPGAAEALRSLDAAGYRLAVISNQPGVADGRFPEEALAGVTARLRALLAEAGISLNGCYYCPHHPRGRLARYRRSCGCRKPAPGLILRACAETGADPAGSWVVGDILDDVEAARRAGCRAVLLDSGGETAWAFSRLRRPDYIAATWREAVRVILSDAPRRLR